MCIPLVPNTDMSLIPFLFLDAPTATRYMDRWKPQNVAGQIVSVSGVNAYARARIQLRDPKCVGMLVNVRNVGYVIHKRDDTYKLASCLWASGTPSLQEFRDLREWCECMLSSDAFLDGTQLDDELERELWELSLLDT